MIMNRASKILAKFRARQSDAGSTRSAFSEGDSVGCIGEWRRNHAKFHG